MRNLQYSHSPSALHTGDEPKWLLLLLFAALAAACGAIAGTGNFTLIAIGLGAIAGCAVLPSKKGLLLLSLLGGLVMVGTLQLYVPGTRAVRYVIPLLVAALFAHAVLDRLLQTRSDHHGRSRIVMLAALFFAHAVLSQMINWDGLTNALDQSRAYFQMWLLLPCFTLLAWDEKFIAQLPKLMLCVALVQLPLVAQQYFVLVPQRLWLEAGVVPVDILVGTFGGEKFGGGANSVLSAFLLIVLACVVASWRRAVIGTGVFMALALLLLTPSFFNFAKVSVLYIVIVAGVVFFRDISAKPLRFLAVITTSGLLVFGLLNVFSGPAIGDPEEESQTIVEMIAEVADRQTQSIVQRTGPYTALTRVTTVSFWVDQHRNDNLTHILFGHGPGASRVQNRGFKFSPSLAESKYNGLKIGTTAVSALLWDVGILGLALILGLLVYAFFVCRKLLGHFSRNGQARKAALFEGLSAAVVILAVSLAHKDYFVFNLPYQTLFLSILGFVAYYEQQELRKTAGVLR